MACFNETGDKCFTDQGTLRFRPAPAADERTPPEAACFDCSICLDAAVDPVVTLCGHLYCWPCIYKWMQAETSSPQPRPDQQCPVCKAPLSERALVPLFGRGSLPTNPKGPHQSRLDVPKRPNVTRDAIASVMEEQQRPPGMQQPQLHYGHYPASQWGAGMFSSTETAGGALRGLAAVAVHPLMSRSNYSTRPYQLDTSGYRSPRERRLEMQVEESLHQIWIFLFCGAVLCLLFF